MTRKEEILQNARDILITHGHHRLTMRHVAENVGIKLASLQYHYPTKSVLIEALLLASVSQYHQLMIQLVQSIGSEDDLALIEQLFATYQDEQESGIFEQLWALSVKDAKLKALYEESYSSLLSSIRTIVGETDTTVDEAQKRIRAILIISLLDGLETFLSAEMLRPNVSLMLSEQVIRTIRGIMLGNI